MFRGIGNGFAGRKKSIDRSISVGEATDLLGSLNGSTKGNICVRGMDKFDLTNIAPRDMADFVAGNFSIISDGQYTNIRHLVYSGESSEKHYLELEHGLVLGRFGSRVIRRNPFHRAYINFLVEKGPYF